MGFRTLETSFSLLALPIIFSRISEFNRDRLSKVFLFFSMGIFIAGVICLVNAAFAYGNNSLSTEVFFFYDFTNVINSHPTYLAYYLIFAITFGLYAMNYEKLKLPVWVFLSFISFYFIILLLTGGQTAFISLLFVFSFFILKFLLGQPGRIEKINFAFVLVMLISILWLNAGDQTQREQANFGAQEF
jgi:hypothetical protein